MMNIKEGDPRWFDSFSVVRDQKSAKILRWFLGNVKATVTSLHPIAAQDKCLQFNSLSNIQLSSYVAAFNLFLPHSCKVYSQTAIYHVNGYLLDLHSAGDRVSPSHRVQIYNTLPEPRAFIISTWVSDWQSHSLGRASWSGEMVHLKRYR